MKPATLLRGICVVLLINHSAMLAQVAANDMAMAYAIVPSLWRLQGIVSFPSVEVPRVRALRIA